MDGHDSNGVAVLGEVRPPAETGRSGTARTPRRASMAWVWGLAISGDRPPREHAPSRQRTRQARRGVAAWRIPIPPGPARELGRGWKCRPYVMIGPGEECVLAEIDGPGALNSMWFGGAVSRETILRITWDDQAEPSVECPITDFFAIPWGVQDPKTPTAGPLVAVNSLPVAVNPNRGLNCFWEMPFRRRCRITLENRHPDRGEALLLPGQLHAHRGAG